MVKSTNTNKTARKEALFRSDVEISVVLPDIRSSYNIGSIFRTSDAAGVSRVVLAGYSPCPLDKFNRPQKEIAKTALGAEKSIPWIYEADQKKVIRDLKKEGFVIVAVEQDSRSKNYKDLFKTLIPKPSKTVSSKAKASKNIKIAVVFGNEVGGIPKDALRLADHVVDIPMKGEKESLNVSVSAGIILYELAGN